MPYLVTGLLQVSLCACMCVHHRLLLLLGRWPIARSSLGGMGLLLQQLLIRTGQLRLLRGRASLIILRLLCLLLEGLALWGLCVSGLVRRGSRQRWLQLQACCPTLPCVRERGAGAGIGPMMDCCPGLGCM